MVKKSKQVDKANGKKAKWQKGKRAKGQKVKGQEGKRAKGQKGKEAKRQKGKVPEVCARWSTSHGGSLPHRPFCSTYNLDWTDQLKLEQTLLS